MPSPVTIYGEIRLPAAFLQGQSVDVIERYLQAAGLLPVQAQQQRWRMDPEAPGGYVLTYEVMLDLEETWSWAP